MKKYWLGVWTLISVVGLYGQSISGTVYDEISNGGLAGATITLLDGGEGGTSDETGRYELQNLTSGRHTLMVTYVGYEALIIGDVWVKNGKVTRQDVFLRPANSHLDEVTVTASRSMVAPGRVNFNEEQINRFAATYYDPARLVTSSPDVAVTNDQNNEISVRGLSPNYNTWRLEGAEVVNPNHLSNAGTFLDQPGPTGGGVNMLSAQMLSQSSFLYSTFDNSYTNSAGGIFDMNFKKGTAAQRQYTAQASLIGFDLATEGPFKEGGKMTYSANYRYSFTGLLTNFGVDFGGEAIGFQDLAFNIASPIGKRSEWSCFAVGGISSNEFSHLTFEESETFKDRKDIDYHNRTGIAGLKLKNGFANSSLTTTLAFSGYDNSRAEKRYDEEDQATSYADIDQSKGVISLHTRYTGRIGNGTYDVGVMANSYEWEYTNSEEASAYDLVQFLVAPYAQWRFRLGKFWEGNLGVTYNQSQDDHSVNPRASISYLMSEYHQLTLAAGRYSQLLNPYNYSFVNEAQKMYWSPDTYNFLQSSRLTLSHRYLKNDLSVNTELFSYYFPEVYAWSGYPEAGSYGVTITAEKSFRESDYFRIGGSVFNSSVAGYNHQYSTLYNVSAAYGREWHFNDREKNRTLGVNIRALFQGKQHYSAMYYMGPEDAIKIFSSSYNTTPYNRVDIRVQWVKTRAHMTTSWALDLQNVAGIKNVAYKYYDYFAGGVEKQYQLGIIPVLAYRVEW